MADPQITLDTDVTTLLDALNPPFRNEIEYLGRLILSADTGLTENIKWNGPNCCFDNEDRITMRVQAPKQLQLIFHRGAKVKEQPKDKLIKDESGLLAWKENDRAVASFKNMAEIEGRKEELTAIEILSIADDYEFMDEELIEMLTDKMNDTLKMVYKI